MAHNGTVYVSDPGSGRILVLSSGGRLLAQWGTGGAAAGRFWFPASVALDARGQLWVNDMANGRVQTLGADGRFHVRFTVAHPGTGMAIDRQGNVYIGQQLGQQMGQDVVISKFSPSGTLLARWGVPNMADPPSGIAVAPNGDVVVVGVFLYRDPKRLDLNGANILRLSPAGKQLGLIHLGYFGPGPGIAVDAQENITIAYGTPPHVERYSSSGTLLASWGAPKPVARRGGPSQPCRHHPRRRRRYLHRRHTAERGEGVRAERDAAAHLGQRRLVCRAVPPSGRHRRRAGRDDLRVRHREPPHPAAAALTLTAR